MVTQEEALAYAISGALLKGKPEQSAAIITSRDAVEVDLALAKFFAGKSYSGVILCMDRPSSFYMEALKQEGIDPSGLYFIDVGRAAAQAENVSNVSEPYDLTFTKIEVTRVAQRLRMKDPKRKLFFLNDSIITLLQYNEEKLVGRFIHELGMKLREMEVYSITLLEPGQSINAAVERMSDKVVKID